MDSDRDIEDFIDLTDTSDSTISDDSNVGVFESITPFVLELHDIRKDDPLPTENVAPAAKTKKHKKKKKGQPARDKSNSSVSSDTMSEASSLVPSPTEAKEEFYDAHESYHAIADRDQGPVITAARLQAHSETIQNPKVNPPPVTTAPDQQTTTSTARKEPLTITDTKQSTIMKKGRCRNTRSI